jgi:hypothetical protein
MEARLTSAADPPNVGAMLGRLSPLLLAAALLSVTAHRVCARPGLSRAKAEEPVVEELMGGCSLQCAFDWTVEVQMPGTTKFTKLPLLRDERAETAWIAEGNAVGAMFRIGFPKQRMPELEETPLYGLDLVNGQWKTEELWAEHARLKKVRLHYKGKPFRDLLFPDSRRWVRAEFPDIFITAGDALLVEVLEIYPGRNGRLAISEFVLQGAH